MQCSRALFTPNQLTLSQAMRQVNISEAFYSGVGLQMHCVFLLKQFTCAFWFWCSMYEQWARCFFHYVFVVVSSSPSSHFVHTWSRTNTSRLNIRTNFRLTGIHLTILFSFIRIFYKYERSTSSNRDAKRCHLDTYICKPNYACSNCNRRLSYRMLIVFSNSPSCCLIKPFITITNSNCKCGFAVVHWH